MHSSNASPPLPLAAIIAASVALNETLASALYPQARHHARVVTLRATEAGFDAVADEGRALMELLNRAIRPDLSTWTAALDALHRAIDGALEVAPPPQR